MTFDADIAAGCAAIYAKAGTAATYTPVSGGDAVSCTIIVSTERVAVAGFDYAAASQVETLDVQVAEVSSVSEGDTFETATRTYTVMEELSNDGVEIQAAVR